MNHPPLLPVILCGGSGTRLWPLSRETYPKQFLALGGDGVSMLQDTVHRLKGVASHVPQSSPIVVCNQEHRFLAAQQLQEAGVEGARLILEPCGRNTAPALSLAALVADPQAILLAMPADHVITQAAPLHAAVEKAWQHACDGAMVTFGIIADRPETGYGYIQKAQAVEGDNVFSIQSFAEKPSLECLAAAFQAAAHRLWTERRKGCLPDRRRNAVAGRLLCKALPRHRLLRPLLSSSSDAGRRCKAAPPVRPS